MSVLIPTQLRFGRATLSFRNIKVGETDQSCSIEQANCRNEENVPVLTLQSLDLRTKKIK